MIREITATDMYTTGLKHLTCIFFFKKAAKNIQPELRSSILFLVSLIMRKTSRSFRISLFRHTLTVTELSPSDSYQFNASYTEIKKRTMIKKKEARQK